MHSVSAYVSPQELLKMCWQSMHVFMALLAELSLSQPDLSHTFSIVYMQIGLLCVHNYSR